MCENKVCTKCKRTLPTTKEYFYFYNKDKCKGVCKECLGSKFGIKRVSDKIGMKICNKCHVELAIDNFGNDKRKKDGLKCVCRNCNSIYKKEWKKKNAVEISIKDKIYRDVHKIESSKHYKIYMSIEKNQIRVSEYNRIYNKENERKRHERDRIWRRDNPEKEKERQIKNNLTRRLKGKLVINTLTANEWKKVKEHFNNRCAYCNKELKLTFEHFIPLSKGGEYATSNIIPACQYCNSSKRDRDFFDWYPKHRFYSKKREKIILEYLHYDHNIQQLSIL